MRPRGVALLVLPADDSRDAGEHRGCAHPGVDGFADSRHHRGLAVDVRAEPLVRLGLPGWYVSTNRVASSVVSPESRTRSLPKWSDSASAGNVTAERTTSTATAAPATSDAETRLWRAAEPAGDGFGERGGGDARTEPPEHRYLHRDLVDGVPADGVRVVGPHLRVGEFDGDEEADARGGEHGGEPGAVGAPEVPRAGQQREQDGDRGSVEQQADGGDGDPADGSEGRPASGEAGAAREVGGEDGDESTPREQVGTERTARREPTNTVVRRRLEQQERRRERGAAERDQHAGDGGEGVPRQFAARPAVGTRLRSRAGNEPAGWAVASATARKPIPAAVGRLHVLVMASAPAKTGSAPNRSATRRRRSVARHPANATATAGSRNVGARTWAWRSPLRYDQNGLTTMVSGTT